jgi:hypothetical protein
MNCGRAGKVFRRLNAIHLLLIGADYDIVLRNSRASGRMLRLWISRFNAQRIDGLIYRPRPGRPGRPPASSMAVRWTGSSDHVMANLSYGGGVRRVDRKM